MRLHSTRDSVHAGDFTWMAIVECVIATILYFALADYLGTLKYYALAILLTPLTLFRTDEATNWALSKYRDLTVRGQALGHALTEYSAPVAIAAIILLFAVEIAWGFIYRIVSVIYWFLRQPAAAFRQMPSNWLRQTLCIDLVTPPEILPLLNFEWTMRPEEVARFPR